MHRLEWICMVENLLLLMIDMFQAQYNSLKRLLDEKQRGVEEKKREISSKQR